MSDSLIVDASLKLQATQDNCGNDFQIDATDTIDLEMNPYLDDYDTVNAVYIEGNSELGNAYFKIIASSNIPIDHINLIKLTSTIHRDGFPEETTPLSTDTEDCPAAAIPDGKQVLCFKIPVADLYGDLGTEDLVKINLAANVEISYISAKRDTGLGSNYDLRSSIRVVPIVEESSATSTSPVEETSNMSTTVLAVIVYLILSLF